MGYLFDVSHVVLSMDSERDLFFYMKPCPVTFYVLLSGHADIHACALGQHHPDNYIRRRNRK